MVDFGRVNDYIRVRPFRTRSGGGRVIDHTRGEVAGVGRGVSLRGYEERQDRT